MELVIAPLNPCLLVAACNHSIGPPATNHQARFGEFTASAFFRLSLCRVARVVSHNLVRDGPTRREVAG
jgi:hypothetical protein